MYKKTTGICKITIQCTKEKQEIENQEKMNRMTLVSEALRESLTVMVPFCYQIKIVISRSCYYLHDVISKHASQNKRD